MFPSRPGVQDQDTVSDRHQVGVQNQPCVEFGSQMAKVEKARTSSCRQWRLSGLLVRSCSLQHSRIRGMPYEVGNNHCNSLAFSKISKTGWQVVIHYSHQAGADTKQRSHVDSRHHIPCPPPPLYVTHLGRLKDLSLRHNIVRPIHEPLEHPAQPSRNAPPRIRRLDHDYPPRSSTALASGSQDRFPKQEDHAQRPLQSRRRRLPSGRDDAAGERRGCWREPCQRVLP